MEIKFKSNDEGKATARIDNLEISISSSDDKQEYNADIIVYENRIEVPCEYEDCPKNLENDDCDYYNGDIEMCPYSFEEEQIDSYTSFSETTFSEIKNKIANMFLKNDDGLGHRHHWPQKAATNFMNKIWNLKIG